MQARAQSETCNGGRGYCNDIEDHGGRAVVCIMPWCSAARNARGGAMEAWRHGASAGGCLSACCPPAVWRSSGWQFKARWRSWPWHKPLSSAPVVAVVRDDNSHAGLMRVRYDHRLSALPPCRPHGHRLCIHQHARVWSRCRQAQPKPRWLCADVRAPLAPSLSKSSILQPSAFTPRPSPCKTPSPWLRPARVPKPSAKKQRGWPAGHNNVVPSVPRWRWPALSVSVSDSELRLLTDCHGLPQASRAAGHVSAKPHLHRRHALLWHVGYAPPLNDLSQVTSNSRLPSPAGCPSC